MKLLHQKQGYLWLALLISLLFIPGCGVTDNDKGDSNSANLPDAPTSFDATSGTNAKGILCSWQVATTGNAADSVFIYRSYSSDGDYSLLAKVAITTTSYLDTSADKDRVLYYRITAKNSYGESSPSNYDEGHVGNGDGGEFGTPANLRLLMSSAGFHLHWDMEPSHNVSYYTVSKYADTTALPYDVDTLKSSEVITGQSPTITDSLGAADIFFYKVTAHMTSDTSTSSSFFAINVATTVALYLPGTPENLQATQGDLDSAIGLSWEVQGVTHEGYILHRFTAPDETPVAETLSLTSGAGMYIDSVSPGDTVYYRLSTFNFAGESAASELVIGFAKKAATQFHFTLKNVSLSPTTIGIRCSSQTADLYSYNLYRATSASGSYSLISQAQFDSLYVDSSLSVGTAYYYKAVAYFKSDTSAMSTALMATTLSAAPTDGVVLSVNSHTALLDWEGTSSMGYTLYLREADTALDTFVVTSGTQLQLPDTTLLPNSAYSFWLHATPPVGVVAEPALSDTFTFTSLYRYDGTITASSDNPSGISLTWNRLYENGTEVGNQYAQLFKKGPGENSFTLFQDNLNDTVYLDKQVVGDSSYHYYVMLRSPANLSENSDTVIGIQPGFDQPDSLWGANNQDGKITLSWKRVAAAQSYVLYRSTERNGTYEEIATAVTDTQYVDNNVYNGLDYYYGVKAVSSTGISSEMTKGAFNYHSDPKSDFYVQNLQGAAGAGAITLTWEASTATGVSYSDHSYIILRGEGASSKVIDTVTAPTLTYTDTSVVAGTTYRYTLVARVTISGVTYTSGFGATVSDLTPTRKQ